MRASDYGYVAFMVLLIGALVVQNLRGKHPSARAGPRWLLIPYVAVGLILSGLIQARLGQVAGWIDLLLWAIVGRFAYKWYFDEAP